MWKVLFATRQPPISCIAETSCAAKTDGGQSERDGSCPLRPGFPRNSDDSLLIQSVASDMGGNGRELLYNVGVGGPVSPACAEASADKPMPL